MERVENKKIVMSLKNYYDIVNYRFDEKDTFGKKLIQIFQEYAFSSTVENKSFLNKLSILSKAIDRYFNDLDFKKELSNSITSLKIKRDESNVFEIIVDEIIKTYNKYLEYYTRNLYIPRWI